MYKCKVTTYTKTLERNTKQKANKKQKNKKTKKIVE
jgi:hypothetical protein